MDLDTFTNALKNTAENLPRVLKSWGDLDDALMMHYADEVVRVVLEIKGARAAALKSSRYDVLAVIGGLTHQLALLADPIEQVMGIEVSGLLSPPGTSIGARWPDDASALDGGLAQAA